jgi:glycyl-tRNA synthetase beta chain
VRYDIVDSVISFQKKSNDPLDVYNASRRASLIHNFLKEKNGEEFMTLFTRIDGILNQSSEELRESNRPINEGIFECQEERNVCNALNVMYNAVLEDINKKDFSSAMPKIASLFEDFEAFFNAVKVNADNALVRENRYTILKKCMFLYEKVSDFSKIRRQ